MIKLLSSFLHYPKGEQFYSKKAIYLGSELEVYVSLSDGLFIDKRIFDKNQKSFEVLSEKVCFYKNEVGEVVPYKYFNEDEQYVAKLKENKNFFSVKPVS